MALKKKKQLRKIELTFTGDLIHPDCHCIYHNVIEEDGKEIAKTIHREVDSVTKVIENLSSRKVYINKD